MLVDFAKKPAPAHHASGFAPRGLRDERGSTPSRSVASLVRLWPDWHLPDPRISNDFGYRAPWI